MLNGSYDTHSPLTDANYILYLAVTAPEYFPLEDGEMSGSSPPVPSLMNVHGLATTGLESGKEGKRSEEEKELMLRLENLRSSSMDEIQFRQKVTDLRLQELMIEVRLL